MYVIAGLGNPGSKYEKTRHNVGFQVIDRLAEKYHIDMNMKKHKAICGTGAIEGMKVMLVKPQTFMNLSGESIRACLDFYKIDPSHLVVISDDIAQKPGKIRIRQKGSSGGQKGLGDIIYQLGRDDFPRIRLGVGEKPHPDYDLAAWVVSEFTPDEQKTLFDSFGCAHEGLLKLLAGDIAAAQQICNSYSPEEKKA